MWVSESDSCETSSVLFPFTKPAPLFGRKSQEQPCFGFFPHDPDGYDLGTESFATNVTNIFFFFGLVPFSFEG